jgi:phospholipid-binding lipoprotein MlaA
MQIHYVTQTAMPNSIAATSHEPVMTHTTIIPLVCLLACLGLSGCASPSHNPKDPFESFNRGVYKFNDTVDRAVVKPVAQGYNAVVPSPMRRGVSNFFSNLNDVTVTANDLLQLKVKQATSDTGRIIVNTTVGLLGLIDVASSVGLAKHNEDFGQTLGYWGIGSGPYLMLPLFGPSSVRDSVGLYADTLTSETNRLKHVAVRNEVYVTKALVRRAGLLDEEQVLDEAAIDRYSFIRDAYLQHRQNLVYDGNPPREKYDDEDDDSKPEAKPDAAPADTKPDAAPPDSKPETKPENSSSSKLEFTHPAAAEEAPDTSPVAIGTTPFEPTDSAQNILSPVPQSSPHVIRIWLSQEATIQ